MWSTPAWADPRDDARRHFAAGLEAVGAGQFDIAVQRFLAAQEAFPHPTTLYNIGKAYADGGDLQNGLTYLRQFREADPAHASFVDPLIGNIEQRLGAAASRGGGGSSGRAVATGEEAARFDAIVSELRALTDALEARSAELVPDESAAVADTAPIEPIEPVEGATDASFLQDAYQRVVVTASRVGQEPLDSPSTVTILTAEDIRLSGALDVPDLLRRVVGVEAMAPSAGHSDIAIRGFQRKLNNTVLFLVDGRSQYLDFLGPTFWGPIPIQLEEIERIEVIRGPGSAVYGANAVTGVVNIITRAPGEGRSELTATAGTIGVRRLAAVATGRIGQSAYRLSAGYQQQGAWSKEARIDPGEDGPLVSFFEDNDLALQSIRVNARADRPLGEWGAFSLSAGLSESTLSFISLGILKNQGWVFHNQYVRGDLFVGDLHVRSFWTNTTGNIGYAVQYQGERSYAADHDNDNVDVELELPKSFVTGPVRHQFNVGGGWRYKGMRWGYLQGGFDQLYVENHFSAFANEQATLGRLSAVGSVRVDVHPLIDVERTTSPRGALVWRLFDETSLRATAGSAFRVPTALESYLGVALVTPTDAVYINDLENRDLLPERITTYELGIHDESTFFHQADLVLYYNHLTNLIYTTNVERVIEFYNPKFEGFPLGNNHFVNLEPVYDGVGIEGDLELYPTDGLDVFVNGSINRMVQNVDGEKTVDKSSSTVKLNVGSSYRTPYRTDLSLWVNWQSPQDWPLRNIDPASLTVVVDKEPLPARTVVTARVAVRPLAEEDVELALTGWNLAALFGEGFREHPQGQRTVGRLYGTVSWRF